jgi:hypothetical protein
VRARLRFPACNLIDVALAGTLTLLLILFTRTAADADLWGHLRFGADLLRVHRLPADDPYSFTSDILWINHEWLAELVIAAFYACAGALGLNLLKLLVIGSIGAFVWRMAARDGASRLSTAVLTAFVLLTTYTRTQVLRPQLFSVLLFCVLLLVIRRVEDGEREPFLTLPALFCVWANAHGAWIVGFGVLSVWTVLWIIEHRTIQEALRRANVLLAATAATLVNPYGVGLWKFLHDTVGLSRTDIVDWKPVFEFPPAIIGLELILPVLAVAAIVVCRRVPGPRHLAVVGLLTFATCRVGRVDAFLQLAVAILLAPEILGGLNALDARIQRRTRLTRRSHAHAAAALALVVAAAISGVSHIGRIYIEGDWVPDASAVAFLQQHASKVRLLTWFDWGEYAIWHTAPGGIRVSMDGRRETVYSDKVVREHFAFYANATPDACRYPDTIGADRIWLPTRLPIVRPLQEHGWHTVFQGRNSVVLSRDMQLTQFASASQLSRPYFPGP